jgi:hypothetical protein
MLYRLHIPRVVEYIHRTMEGVDENDPYRCTFIFCPCKFTRQITYFTSKHRQQQKNFIWKQITFEKKRIPTEKIVEHSRNCNSSQTKEVSLFQMIAIYSIKAYLPLIQKDSTSPDPALVAYVKQLMTEYNLLQKDIAEELHIRSLSFSLSLSPFFLTFQLFSSFFEFNMNQSLKQLIDLNRLRNILTFLLIYYS